ncbi:MAG: sugar ABC transporter permease [Fimbriimonas sp.]|nr:sugar ABC transporter permease [Fimbriimonas sp.]
MHNYWVVEVKTKRSIGERRALRNGLLFASPWLIGLTVFGLYPILSSLYYSLCQYDGIRSPHWVGLRNYHKMFFEDELFFKALYNTLYMVCLGVPLSILCGLSVALLLNQKVKGIALYRTIYYLPSVVPVVASSILWLWLLNPDIGLVNIGLQHLGVKNPPAWLGDPVWSKPALLLMGLWGVGGGMVIYLAALQNVSETLYEAAALDGAGSTLRFRHVTLPMITPVILFNLITSLIGTFQYFTEAYVMTSGGPQDSTTFYALRLFNAAFQDFHLGYASAMAWVLFVLTLACALIVFKSSLRWVYYEGELK